MKGKPIFIAAALALSAAVAAPGTWAQVPVAAPGVGVDEADAV